MSDFPSSEQEDPPRLRRALDGLRLRGIGPAFMGGRIADLAIHPSRPRTWLVAAGSGGVWRTDNAGTTWRPLFDDQRSYSIGCVRIDPSRPEVIWVGTGEAVSGRHVGWGDGVYRSGDGGANWTHAGLAGSEHIADILIDPRNGDVVYVAAEGPLWSPGGERGLFKTTDGGRSWDTVLEVDEHTGVTSACFAPDDPDTLYAATYQRRRRVWSFLGGGPGSGIQVSNDAGSSWRSVTAGLPDGDVGRIGLAVTPADPDLVYATIEAAEKDERGFYRSIDRGSTWERRNEYLSGGTGPHYYQRIFASPTDPHDVYQADVFLHVTRDGGATFTRLEDGKHKHSDNHALWIDPAAADHLIVGCDAGLYETFDDGASWRHVSNLPIAQFYRVAVDDSIPFTNVLGGAQDLGTLFGPTRTLHVDGVRNQDWAVRLGADGYHAAFDPDDGDISYVEWQAGNLMRHDRRTMELCDIQPRPGPGEPAERWNWDTPLLISPHDSTRLYVGSQRLWRSDDRGDSWTAVSPDLTTDRNRYERAVGDRVVSVDALYDHAAMSHYSTISAIAESPVVEGVLYAATDDGLIQVSENGGASWRRAGAPPGLPSDAFINDLEASRHDADVVFVAADDHKSGDYRPYLYRSADRGRTWQPLRGDLPDGTTVWAIEQDHLAAHLLFVGAEHGLFVSLDGGDHWHRLTTGMPTIAVRDLALQRRDDDLVAGTFGRGIYVLDDYGPLRTLTEAPLTRPAVLFPVRNAWWYVPYQPMQAAGQPTLGTTAWRAPNPPFGATFTYHLNAEVTSLRAERRAGERELDRTGADVPFPGWDRLWAERLQGDPVLVLVVRDTDGVPVRAIAADTAAGLHRTTWDLRYPAPDPVALDPPGFQPPWINAPQGPLVEPGRYTVELVLASPSGDERLAGPEEFSIVPVPAAGDAPGGDAASFRQVTAGLARRVAGAVKEVEMARDRIRHLRTGIVATPGATGLLSRLADVHGRLEELAVGLAGDPVREGLDEPVAPSLRDLVDRVATYHWNTTGPPTTTQRESITRASDALEPALDQLRTVLADLSDLATALDAAGGTWTPR